MRFQCILCFTIIRVGDDAKGQIQCPNCGNRMSIPRSAFEVGCVIDDFVIEGEIGKGGMAVVYRAKQLSMDRPVALKILADAFAGEEKFARSFLKEAKSAARINHPNLIQAVKVGTDEGCLFYAMELVKGVTVGERITRDNALEMDYALNIVQQTAEALHVAWTQEGLIHRDIKPDNIMLADDGHAKVMDLGIAVRREDAENAEVSGTPKFMSPEQFRGRALDCRSDIYSLGVTLYNMLVGSPPFTGKTLKDVAREHLSREVAFPEKEVLYIPQRVKRLISKMMAKDPDERYKDYDELLEDVVFIRKRLAPDEHMVPSVHTVSFSKYKVMEGIQDSPSEVFRRREEKKKQVEVARQQAAVAKDRPEPMFNPRHLVMIAGLGALVLLLIGLLVFAAWRTRPSSSFELAVNDFLAKGISNADRVAAIKSAEALGTKLPASPSSREREAWIRLQNGTQRLRAAELEEWGASLGKQRQQLIGDREQLDVDRARARIDADFLLAERVRLDLDLADLESQRGEILERQMSLKTSAETAASLDARIAAQRDNLAKLQAQVRRSSRAAQQLELIEYCRNRRFSDARLLVEGMSGTTEEALQWRKQKLAEIEVTQRIIDTVYDSGGLFAGTRLSAGRLASVSKDRLRVVKSSGAVDTYEDALLNSLTVREIADMLATAELAIGETSEMAELALCWGEFKYAVSLRPNDEALQQLTSECLTFSKNEITLFYQSGNRKYAAALASRLRTRFAGLSQYQEVEDSLRDMFGVARTTVPDLDAGVPAATLVLPTAPTVPAVLPTPSTPPKPVPRVSPAD